MSEEEKKPAEETKEVDIYRDTPVRLLGYCNEVGESFRYLAPWFVKPSYAISFAYVFADTYDKAMKQYKKDGNKTSKTLNIKAVDCLVWQTFASVVIPGFVINRIVKMSRMLFKTPAFKLVPTLIGLASIPLIVHPIDHSVDFAMDKSYRSYFKDESSTTESK